MQHKKKTLHHNNYENIYTLCTRKVSLHGKGSLDVNVKIYTNKKGRILQERNQNYFASHNAASLHLTEGLLPKCKAANAQPTEQVTLQSQRS